MFRLMCITAHPDDEAGSFGGTLRIYADRGVETSVVCLTPGQAGSHRGGAGNDRELADIRRKEFAASCKILKVTRPVVLDYADGQLYRQELNRVVYELVSQIRQFRPQVIITYGADGGATGHPDHALAGIFATLAFQWAGRTNRYTDQFDNRLKAYRPQKLYYMTADFAIPGRQPPTFSPATAAIETSSVLDIKIMAFKAHTTQKPLWPFLEENVRKLGPRENFHLAASVNSAQAKIETDLFAGVDED
jgi:LmbE family N-acetylglucosaminyl deacetylase